MFRNNRLMISVMVLLCTVTVTWADVRLPAIFGDHMVLQRQQPLRIWGWADAGERVSVTIGRETKSVNADAQGQWQVELGAIDKVGPISMRIKGKNEITLKDVLVGEVWVCSGQSNMGWSFNNKVVNGEAEVAAANYPKIRLITVPRKPATEPQANFEGKWSACTPETTKPFSAVAYFFGRALHKDLGVPVGLINTSWGGTRVEAWTSTPALKNISVAQPLFEWWHKAGMEYDPDMAKQRFDRALAKWEQARDKAKAEGKKVPRKPTLKTHPRKDRHHPANLYNGMIAPLLPLSVRGAIWYQGESNVARAYQYRSLFQGLIQNWRRDFQNPDMPFGFVQLAPFTYSGNRVGALPELWEAQLLTLKLLPSTGMAVTTDIATINDIHPPNKQDVGKRLALWALGTTYGEDIVYSGPIYQVYAVNGKTIELSFSHTGSGLATRDGQAPSHFTIAGKDRIFYPATAKIVGEKIVVSAPQVSEPVAVRFAWINTAEPNLMNKEGLPASPFRTDNWPGITRDNMQP